MRSINDCIFFRSLYSLQLKILPQTRHQQRSLWNPSSQVNLRTESFTMFETISLSFLSFCSYNFIEGSGINNKNIVNIIFSLNIFRNDSQWICAQFCEICIQLDLTTSTLCLYYVSRLLVFAHMLYIGKYIFEC